MGTLEPAWGPASEHVLLTPRQAPNEWAQQLLRFAGERWLPRNTRADPSPGWALVAATPPVKQLKQHALCTCAWSSQLSGQTTCLIHSQTWGVCACAHRCVLDL